ncbi:unnamed protein product [Cochlearia groenlandica]
MGKDHAKWSPAATVMYVFEPDIVINEDMMDTLTYEVKIDLIESSPTKVFYIDPVTKQLMISLVISREDSEGSYGRRCGNGLRSLPLWLKPLRKEEVLIGR